MCPALKAGYATAGTDTGHSGNPIDASWALCKPGLVADFGWRAIHAMTDTAKAVITRFYGVGPSRSYFIGCSTGGRQALMEAQRYPGDYDGIVAGAPAPSVTHNMFNRNWNSKAVHDDPLSVISKNKLPAIRAAVLAHCDARDGLVDGVIDDPRRCRWNPSTIRCDVVESDACLTDAQVEGLKKLYRGAPGRVSPGFLRGGEDGPKGEVGPDGALNLGGWETWIVGTSPETNHKLQDTFFKYMVFEDPHFDWRTLDFRDDVTFTDAKLAAMLNATDPDLEPFRARGGKLLIYHG
jgi:feruloyl esterase